MIIVLNASSAFIQIRKRVNIFEKPLEEVFSFDDESETTSGCTKRDGFVKYTFQCKDVFSQKMIKAIEFSNYQWSE